MKKRIVAFMIMIAISAGLVPTPVLAASKVKMVAYDQVIKKGNTIYCAGSGTNIYKIKVRNGEVVDKKKIVSSSWGSEYSSINRMKKRGKYLYYVEWTEGTLWWLKRVNIKTGKVNTLCTMGDQYAFKKNKLYVKKWKTQDLIKRTTRVMKLNGKNKKKTSKRVVMKRKKSNAKGYSVKIISFTDYYGDPISASTYLKTPKGNYYLGTTKPY